MAVISGLEKAQISMSGTTQGSLVVSGSITTPAGSFVIDTEEFLIEDDFLLLNAAWNTTGSGLPILLDSFISVETSGSPSILWDASENRWNIKDRSSEDTLATLQDLVAIMEELTPVGSVQPYAGDVAPSGWILCSGQVLPIAGQYQKLYNAIGSDPYYSAPSGYFRVPVIQDVFVIGADPAGSLPWRYSDGQFKHKHQSTHYHSMGNHVHSVNHAHTWDHYHPAYRHFHRTSNASFVGGWHIHKHPYAPLTGNNWGLVPDAPGYWGGFWDRVIITQYQHWTDSNTGHTHVLNGNIGNTSKTNWDTSSTIRTSGTSYYWGDQIAQGSGTTNGPSTANTSTFSGNTTETGDTNPSYIVFTAIMKY